MISRQSGRTGGRASFRAAPFLAALVLISATWTDPAAAQDSATPTWSAQLRSTAYFYQVEDQTEAETDLAPFYEHFDLSVARLAAGRLSFRVSGRYGTDLMDDGAIDGEDRLYVGYAGLRFDRWDTRARVGRQFLQEGTNRHTLDGVWLALRPSRAWQVHAWGGAEAPSDRSFEAADFDQDAVYGARVIGRVSGWVSTRESNGETNATPVGGELILSPTRGLRTMVRGSWETEESELERFDVLAQVQPWPEKPMLTVQYLDRKPMIEAGSYFARFNELLERVRVLRASLRYEGPRGLGAEIESFSSWVDERNTNRIGIALLAPHVRLGWSTKSGDAGSDSRFYGDVHYEFGHWLQLSGGAVISEYALLEDAEEADERELVTAFARARALVTEGVRVTTELQSLENPFYSHDVRFLVGLDLAMGRGASRFGWGAGGSH